MAYSALVFFLHIHILSENTLTIGWVPLPPTNFRRRRYSENSLRFLMDFAENRNQIDSLSILTARVENFKIQIYM